MSKSLETAVLAIGIAGLAGGLAGTGYNLVQYVKHNQECNKPEYRRHPEKFKQLVSHSNYHIGYAFASGALAIASFYPINKSKVMRRNRILKQKFKNHR